VRARQYLQAAEQGRPLDVTDLRPELERLWALANAARAAAPR